MSPYLGEFLGTATLMLLGSGVVAGVLLPQSKSQHGGWLVIAVAWGLAVLFGIYAAAPSGSGAHMNSALTIALAALGKFPWAQVPGYVAAQVSGAALGSTLAYLAYLPHWNGDLDPLACGDRAQLARRRRRQGHGEILGDGVSQRLLVLGNRDGRAHRSWRCSNHGTASR